MATKPTDRILDWASGGTTTDPGGSKEAAGWVTDDRPPANWWNWILNSFGQWLSYFEDHTDEFLPVLHAYVVTDGAGSTTTLVGSGFTGGATVGSDGVSLTFTNTQAGINYTSVATAFAGTEINAVIDGRSTTAVSVQLYDSGGAMQPDSEVVRFSVVVFGDGT